MNSEKRFSSVDEAIKFITSLPQKGSGASLETMKLFMQRLNNPQDKLSFVHIAGSNGKGSCAKYISDTLSLAGYKTGLFISPYILEFRERISVDGEMIEEERLVGILNDIVTLAEEVGASQFEIITAIAFLYYLEVGVDIVVLETGLGGRFDATNVVRPLVSAIMQISLDHTELLGNSEEKIAAEKAGIIKEGVPVILYPDNKESVNSLLEDTANIRGCNCILSDKRDIEILKSGSFGSVFLYKGDEYSIKMQGIHQVYNAVVAIETVKQIADKYKNITGDIIRSAISNMSFVARFEVLREKPLLIIDGAHNIGGAQALSGILDGYNRKFVGIFSAIKSKNYQRVLEKIAPYLEKIYIVQMDNPRAERVERLIEVLPSGIEAMVISVDEVLQVTKNVDSLVFGSLYLCSDVRNLWQSR